MFPDPHLLTFGGLYYSFQTAGEFVLVKDANGGSFQVQARLSAPVGASSYSVITEVGIQVGQDVVTIDSTRAVPVWVNGVPQTFSSNAIGLAGGLITKTSTGFVVTLGAGETVTTNFNINGGMQTGPATTSGGISISVALGPNATHYGVGGLLGDYSGNPATDLALADGTPEPSDMPTSVLYGAYADSWRVAQAASLLDYGPGQTTATFTDTNYPGTPLSVASFPESAVAAATALVQQQGITDPGLQQAAIYDYLITGNPQIVSIENNLQQQGVTTVTQAAFVAPPPPVEVGIRATEISQVEAGSGPTTATFQIYRTGPDTQPVTVDYTVVAPDGSYIGAGNFGGVLPSGSVTLAASQDTAALTISIPGNLGTAVAKTLELRVSAPTPVVVIGSSAQETIVNDVPVPGPAPVFGLEVANYQALLPGHSGNSWTINLGNLTQNQLFTPSILSLSVINQGSVGTDDLSAAITASGNGGLPTDIISSFSSLAPGDIRNVASIDIATFATGVQTEQLVFTPSAVNESGYAAILPAQTLTVTETIVPLAQAQLSTDLLNFGKVRGGTVQQRAVGITNSGTAGAENLDAGIGAISGAGSGAGTIDLLAVGQTSSAVSIGLNTSAFGGVETGTVAVDFASDGTGVDSLGQTPLLAQDVMVTGTIYRLGAAGVALTHPIVHVGDSGSDTLAISNTDPADGFSENLVADVTGSGGPIGVTAAGSTGEIGAGDSDGTTYGVSYSTAQSGTLTGSVTLAVTSDGGTGAGSIDGYGQLALAPETLPIAVTIDNYATAAVVELSGGPALDQVAGGYTLDFGTVQRGASVGSVVLGVENAATGTADLLDGFFTNSGATAVSLSGFGNFATLAAQQVQGGLDVGLDTSTDGVFTQTVTLHATGTNASGYAGALASEVITITGTVEGNLASAIPVAPNPVDFGNVHVGAALSRALSIANAAPAGGGNEALDGSIGGPTGAVTSNGGAFAGLAPGSTDSTDLAVGLSTATDGVQSGTATISLESDGTGIDADGRSDLPSQTVTVTGTVYALAAPALSGTTLNFGAARTGNTVAPLLVTLGNGVAADRYQEDLQYSLGDLTSGAFTDAGGFNATVAAGQTASAEVGLNTTVAGDFSGSATLLLASTGAGTSGLGLTNLPSETIDLAGTVYAAAVGQVASAVNFGVVHVGDADAQTLTVANTASGAVTDVLVGNVGTVSGTGFGGSGSLGAGLAAGASGGFDFALSTGNAGVFSGSATLALSSHDAALSDAPVSVAPIALAGTVDNYATAQIVEAGGGPVLTGSAASYTLNLGAVGLNGFVPLVDLEVENAAQGQADLLDGRFTTSGDEAITLTGFSPFDGVAAQAAQGGLEVGLNTGDAGVFTAQVTLEATGTNASGYSGALAPEVVTITGTVEANLAAAGAVTPNPVDFGTVHVGATLSQALTVENTAPAARTTEALDGQIGGATGAATSNGGSFTGLGAQGTNGSSLVAGLSTAAPGVQSGSLTVSLESDGNGIDSQGTTMLPSQTVAVTGTVYALAAPLVTGTTLNFGAARVGGSAADQSVTIADGTTASPFQESLVYGLHNPLPAGFAPVSFQTATVVAGSTAQATVMLDTGVAGDFSGATAALALTSTGAGTSGLADTVLAGDTITLDGKVYAAAVAQVASSLNFGVVHVGDSDVRSLAIGNGAAGALTDVLIGHVGTTTGAGFSGSGTLGAGLAAGAGGGLDFALNTGTAGVFRGAASLALASHDADLADEALTAAPVALSGTVDNYATAQVVELSGAPALVQAGTGYTLNLGQVALGAAPVTVELGVKNAAASVADLLDGGFTANGASTIVLSGVSSFAGVAAGDTQGGLDVTLDTGTAGVFSQAITLEAVGTNASGYSGALAPEVITVTGTVHAQAVATLNGSAVVTLPNQRVGAVPASSPVSFTNSAAAGADALDVTVGATTGAATASGTIDLLAPGQTRAAGIRVGVSTASAGGETGAVTLNEYSDGTGVTAIGTTTVTVSGNVYREAMAAVATPAGFIIHTGQTASVAIGIGNTAAADGYSEDLIGGVVSATGGIVTTPAATSDIAAGGSGTIGVLVAPAVAGVFSGAVDLDMISDGAPIDGLGTVDLGVQPVQVTGTVYNYATAAVANIGSAGTLSGSGGSYTLDLGTLTQGTARTQAVLQVENIASGLADALTGRSAFSGSAAFINSGYGTIGTLAAGAASGALDISISTANTGTFTETATLLLASVDSGGSTTLAPVTIAVTGTIVAPEGQVYTLTQGETLSGGGGPNTLIATYGALAAGDQIDAGPSGENTLVLSGGGTFNLALPQILTGVQRIEAQEGQPANTTNGVAYPNTQQTVDLRAGMNDVTLEVAPAAATANTAAPAITIVGAANNDFIDLQNATGADSVTMGAGERFLGGAGNDTILVSAATIGDAINGGTGSAELYFIGGGVVTLGSNVTNIKTLYLARSTGSYTATANSITGLVVQDGNTAYADTLTAGGADQTLTGGGAGKLTMVGAADTTFKDSAALLRGDTIQNLLAGDQIDVTGLGFVASGAGATSLGFSTSGGNTVVSVNSGATSFTVAGSVDQAGFSLDTDAAGTGTLIRYHG